MSSKSVEEQRLVEEQRIAQELGLTLQDFDFHMVAINAAGNVEALIVSTKKGYVALVGKKAYLAQSDGNTGLGNDGFYHFEIQNSLG